MTPALTFDKADALGRVFRVDTASVWVEASDHDRVTRVSVGSLVAIQGAVASEYLVGLLDRVTRDLQDDLLFDETSDGNEASPSTTRQRDLVRVVLLGTYRQVSGLSGDSFKRGADSYPVVDSGCWVIEGPDLQALMNLLTSQVEPERQLRLGTFVADGSATAIADGDRLFQRHAALLGSTGSGKSWSVAVVLERAKRLAHPNLVVFDMHGEYEPLTDGPDPVAKYLKVAGPGDAASDDDRLLFLPWWLLNQEEMQALLLDRTEENAPNQAARLSHHVRRLKAESLSVVGDPELLASFTVDSPVPFDLGGLVAGLVADDEGMVPGKSTLVKGPFNGRLTRFISRLESRIEDRRYGFMFAPPASAMALDWLDDLAKVLLGTSPGIKVVDFSEVPSDVLPVVVGVLARILYDIHFWAPESARTPVTFVCDEAHLYLPARDHGAGEQRALDAFERIAKEGRKYGVSLLVVSQRPSDVSRTVLSQCNNFVVLRLTNDQDQRVVQQLLPDNMGGLAAALPLLDVGEALILGDAMVLPTRIKFDTPATKPNSATKRFWTDWNETPADEAGIVSAVRAMRLQSRP
ncbi:ATP-binding protein [Modestobacter roseus]|uniref:Helicase HerA central domain-containing protein n=1 Tax=Modestobacter roseus TaxID=1181884 RepID=A0A562ILY6_9ACTN|nr:ATP-binding protein [Modestobacter roseus]MQA35942.1 DUF853 family protein [Modestobacter roseus]TWH71846.1 hypothetical protein JD78_00346 [Modestobacter roseus]